MNAGYVYVLAFTNGTVKVGRTQDTGQRLSAHKSAARKFGLTVTGEWVSPLHAEWLENEEALKKIATALGGTAHSKEYFGGVDFAAVVAEARELPFTPAEGIAGQVVPQAPDAVVSDRDRAIQIAGKRAIREAALEEKAHRDAMLAEGGAWFLDMGVPPEFMRDDLKLPWIADAMDDVLHKEAVIERRLALTGSA